jgi:hypothetical protein
MNIYKHWDVSRTHKRKDALLIAHNLILAPIRRMEAHSGLRCRQLLSCDVPGSNWMQRIQNCVPMRRMGTRWHLLSE